MNNQQIEQEVARLISRIEELRALQRGQKHLPFIATHLEEHILKLQQRVAELQRELAS